MKSTSIFSDHAQCSTVHLQSDRKWGAVAAEPVSLDIVEDPDCLGKPGKSSVKPLESCKRDTMMTKRASEFGQVHVGPLVREVSEYHHRFTLCLGCVFVLVDAPLRRSK